MGRYGPFAVRQANHQPRPVYCQRWCGPWPTASLQSAKTRDTEIHPAKTLYVSIYCVCASGIADTGLTQPASSQHGGIDGMNLRSRGQMVSQHARHPDAAGQGDTIENAPLTDFPPCNFGPSSSLCRKKFASSFSGTRGFCQFHGHRITAAAIRSPKQLAWQSSSPTRTSRTSLAAKYFSRPPLDRRDPRQLGLPTDNPCCLGREPLSVRGM